MPQPNIHRLEKSWNNYRARFGRAARGVDRDREYVARCLAYAKPIYLKNLPVIYDQEHLAALVGYEVEYLRRFSNQQGDFYRSFQIPKKTDGFRMIDEPLPSLKEIQRWVLDEILYKLPVSKCAKGFVRGRSIRDNARFHLRKHFVLSLDVKDFFPSLTSKRTFRFFSRLGYCEPVAVMLTKICTLKGGLPQGAPTSPALSNLLVTKADARIFGYCKVRDLRYTRYADDISISGAQYTRPGNIIRFVRHVLNGESLKLNEEKTRVMFRHQCQEVTGVIVNKKLQAPRQVRREIRAKRHYIEKYGLPSHMTYEDISKRHYVEHLMGIANFVLFLDRENVDAGKLLEILRSYKTQHDQVL